MANARNGAAFVRRVAASGATLRAGGAWRRWRARWLLGLLLLVGALVAVIPGLRHAALQSAGWALVASDPLQAADVIVIAVDGGAAEVLEAADLVQRGIAARVAVFSTPPDAITQEFSRRGVQYANRATQAQRMLKELGVAQVERVPQTVAGSNDEAAALPAWCDSNGFRTVIFLSTADHSRRVRRMLARSMAGHATRVLVRYSSYASFRPDSWWLSRDGQRAEFIESEKMLIEVLAHPLSG